MLPSMYSGSGLEMLRSYARKMTIPALESYGIVSGLLILGNVGDLNQSAINFSGNVGATDLRAK